MSSSLQINGESGGGGKLYKHFLSLRFAFPSEPLKLYNISIVLVTEVEGDITSYEEFAIGVQTTVGISFILKDTSVGSIILFDALEISGNNVYIFGNLYANNEFDVVLDYITAPIVINEITERSAVVQIN